MIPGSLDSGGGLDLRGALAAVALRLFGFVKSWFGRRAASDVAPTPLIRAPHPYRLRRD